VKEKTRIQRSSVRKTPTETEGKDENENEEAESTPPPVEMVMLKNKDPVVVDKTFDLDQYLPKELKGSSKYKLSGIVHHHGGSPSSGHYTTDAIRFDNKDDKTEWVTFDDGSAHEANIAKILKSPHSQRTAYLLLYTLEN
jgi:ubiquitin C-terminal hydrolase